MLLRCLIERAKKNHQQFVIVWKSLNTHTPWISDLFMHLSNLCAIIFFFHWSFRNLFCFCDSLSASWLIGFRSISLPSWRYFFYAKKENSTIKTKFNLTVLCSIWMSIIFFHLSLRRKAIKLKTLVKGEHILTFNKYSLLFWLSTEFREFHSWE